MKNCIILKKEGCALELDCKEIRKSASKLAEMLQNITKSYTGETVSEGK